jgi:hypothetical protein
LSPEKREDSDPLLFKLRVELDFGKEDRVVGSGFEGDLDGDPLSSAKLLEGPAIASLYEAGRE